MFTSVNSRFRVLLFLWAFIGGYGNPDCPGGCRCTELTLTCNDSSMEAPPPGTWPDVSEIYFLNTSFSSLTPDSLKGFPNVDVISMKSVTLKELDMRIFANHGGIFLIEVRDSDVESIVPLEEGQELPELFYLRLRYNKIASVPVNLLNGLTCKNLVLDLSGNPLIVPGDRPFLVSGYLRTLDLRECDASGISSETFKALSNLKRLFLTNASVTDVSQKFTSLHQLIYLHLDYNPIKEIKGDFLSEDQNLQYLDLSYTQLEVIEVAAVSGKLKNAKLKIDETPYSCQCKFEDIMSYFKKVVDSCKERNGACPFQKK